MTYGELKTRALSLAKELGLGPIKSDATEYAAFFLEGFKAFYAYVWPSYGSATVSISGTSKIAMETAGVVAVDTVEVAGVELLDRAGRPGPVPIIYLPPTPATGTPTEWATSAPGLVVFDKAPGSSTSVKLTGALAAQTVADATVLDLQVEWLNIVATWMALWITQGVRTGSAQDVGDRMDAALVADIARLSKGDVRSPFLRMRGEKK